MNQSFTRESLIQLCEALELAGKDVRGIVAWAKGEDI